MGRLQVPLRALAGPQPPPQAQVRRGGDSGRQRAAARPLGEARLAALCALRWGEVAAGGASWRRGFRAGGAAGAGRELPPLGAGAEPPPRPRSPFSGVTGVAAGADAGVSLVGGCFAGGVQPCVPLRWRETLVLACFKMVFSVTTGCVGFSFFRQDVFALLLKVKAVLEFK